MVSNRYNGDLSFSLSSGLQIRIPNHQLVVPDVVLTESGIPTFNDSTRAINLNSLQEINKDDIPILGQTFLSSAYLHVDLDQSQFTLWQSNSTRDSKIVALGPSNTCTASSVPGPTNPVVPSTSSTPTDSTAPTGAIVGGAVGGVVLLVSLAVLLFYLRRRRQSAAPDVSAYPGAPQYQTGMGTDPQKLGANELSDSRRPEELPAPNQISELGPGWRHELGS